MATASPATTAAARPGEHRSEAPTGAPGPPSPVGETPEPATALRGAAARIVANMEASLEVPTATSFRVVPARLLEANRKILNNQLKRVGGAKVSFTHLIGYAVVRALREIPVNSTSWHRRATSRRR